MKAKEKELVFVFIMFIAGLVFGFLEMDSLCIFSGIVIVGDVIGFNIANARPNQSKS